MNGLKNILIGFTVFILGLLPTTVYSQSENNQSTSSATPVNSYELFWPITAGRTMGDSLYFLKSIKESFRELLIFGDLKKASYSLELSTKRTVEAEKLYLTDKNYENGKKTLDAAEEKREKIISIIDNLRSKKKSNRAIENKIAETFEKQKILLIHIASNVNPSQKKDLEDSISNINESISKLQES